MIEKRFPIKLPPGLFMNGTEIERAGRWVDGDGIRFDGEEGIIKPVGAKVAFSTQGASISGTPTFMFAYRDTTSLPPTARVIVFTSTKVYRFDYLTTPPTVTDITPTGWSSSMTVAASVQTNTLLFTLAGFGVGSKLYKWSASGLATEVTTFTAAHSATARGVVVTPENFVLILKNNKDVVWPTQHGFTDWTPTTTNSAGGLTIPTAGQVSRLMILGSETLLLATDDLWAMEYVGGDLIYGSRKVGSNCGLVGPNCAIAVGNTAYWMGSSGFFQYDGFVRELPSDVHDYVFGDMNQTAPYYWWAQHRPEASEIWWHYASSNVFGGGRPDRYVIYNYLNGTWSKGALTMNYSVLSPGTLVGLPQLLLADPSGNLFQHEQHDSQTPNAFIESGFLPILGGFDRLVRVQKLVSPDEASGDAFSFKYRLEPGDSETTAFASNGDVRFTGRYIRYRQDIDAAAGRVGIPELGVIPASGR